MPGFDFLIIFVEYYLVISHLRIIRTHKHIDYEIYQNNSHIPRGAFASDGFTDSWDINKTDHTNMK